ncbi:uncharacterized protein LOC114260593 [Camellia sinensis]|uniref:uncharacterized protein LOC114260593 n=1 Tax=Camellia sinensis TaxID=4442 RepID=UPI0010363AC4|nr:uncharacterized protein LOC114260593 [Camellia sinensis]
MARNSVMKMIIDDSDSDSELEIFAIAASEQEQLNNQKQLGLRRSSIQGHAVIYRNQIQSHKRLYQNYFSKTPIYPPNLFKRRFRMSRCLFLRILSMVEAYDPYFVQKQDAIGVLGLSFFQKMTVVMRMLTYGVAADSVDDYVRIRENTTIESLQRFVEAVVAIFSNVYLRMPNKDDIAILLEVEKNRGFLGMLGSIDWRAPQVNYSINENDYTMRYYLADGVHPQWLTFVKTILSSPSNKQIHFAKAQESTRKDVERAFRVLQAYFAIV